MAIPTPYYPIGRARRPAISVGVVSARVVAKERRPLPPNAATRASLRHLWFQLPCVTQAGQIREKPLIVSPHSLSRGTAVASAYVGLAVRLYGVRSLRDWGRGDFSDLIAILNLAADWRISSLNALHAGLTIGRRTPVLIFPAAVLSNSL